MRLLPRDERFFDLFTKVATLNVEAAKQLKVLLGTDMDRRLPIVESIKRLEHEADIVTHEVVTRLDRSFITPLDREDIHMLASRLDDVMDLMDGCSREGPGLPRRRRARRAPSCWPRRSSAPPSSCWWASSTSTSRATARCSRPASR